MRGILKRKRVLFPLILLGESAIFITIAIVFNLGMSNSIFNAVNAFVMNFTVAIFLAKIIKDHKTELSTIKFPGFGFFDTSVLVMLYFFAAVSLLNAFLLPFLILFASG